VSYDNGLSATASGLFFDFTSGGTFRIATTSSPFSAFCLNGTGDYCFSPASTLVEVIQNGTILNQTESGVVEIAEVGTTPLPAAFPLLATGLGALALLGWRRKRTARSVAA
jgi:hypothetical protein